MQRCLLARHAVDVHTQGSVSERIFEPLVQRIKRQGGTIAGGQLVSRCAGCLLCGYGGSLSSKTPSAISGQQVYDCTHLRQPRHPPEDSCTLWASKAGDPHFVPYIDVNMVPLHMPSLSSSCSSVRSALAAQRKVNA